MRAGLPKGMEWVLMVCLLASVIALFSWFAYFVLSAPGVAVDRVGVSRGLWLTAGLSGAVALFSGLLAFHHRREAYGSGDEMLFRVYLIVTSGILLCSGGAALGIALFG